MNRNQCLPNAEQVFKPLDCNVSYYIAAFSTRETNNLEMKNRPELEHHLHQLTLFWLVVVSVLCNP
jgi:hypothetical protein